MSRFLTSLLAMLLRGSTAPDSTRRAGRARRVMTRALEGAAARAIEVEARPREQARHLRGTWSGEVVMTTVHERLAVPGTWALEWQPAACTEQAEATTDEAIGSATTSAVPGLTNQVAWAAHMTRLVTLREPGARLRVGRAKRNGWSTLEVRAPTRPETVVEFDRDALRQLLGGAEIHVELRAFG